MKEKLIVIGIIFGLFASAWGVHTYLTRYALCSDVAEHKMVTEYRFKAIDLRTLNQQIYELQKQFGVNPVNQEKAAELEKLKQERKQTEDEMKMIREKK